MMALYLLPNKRQTHLLSKMPDRAGKILIVEDEPVSRGALATLLRGCGYDIVACPSAEAALQELREPQETAQFALIDLDLPGMSGAELVCRIDQSDLRMEKILITAVDERAVRDFCDEHNVRYLRKPFDFQHLLTLLSRSLPLQ